MKSLNLSWNPITSLAKFLSNINEWVTYFLCQRKATPVIKWHAEVWQSWKSMTVRHRVSKQNRLSPHQDSCRKSPWLEGTQCVNNIDCRHIKTPVWKKTKTTAEYVCPGYQTLWDLKWDIFVNDACFNCCARRRRSLCT